MDDSNKTDRDFVGPIGQTGQYMFEESVKELDDLPTVTATDNEQFLVDLDITQYLSSHSIEVKRYRLKK